jgi:signal transduction histidine kinase
MAMSVADLWQRNRGSWPGRYGLAVLATAVATALQFGLRALGPSRLAFEFYYPTIVLVAMVAGFGPGILTIVLTAVTGSYFFLEPPRTFAVHTPEDLIAPMVFAFTGLLLTLVTCSRNRAEQALRESRAELARITRIATIGELTASIAHQINQPLTAVITNGSASLRWLGMQPPNLEEARDAMTGTIREASRASEVVSRIRALLTKASPEVRPLDVNEVIREVLSLVGTEIARADVHLHIDLASDLSVVPGDRVQLQQVVLNLILNAIEAMNTITDRKRKLLVKSTNATQGVLVKVGDSGTGLILKQEDEVFESFFTTKPQGIGMGLAIARSIVEAHGGHLWATPGSPHGAIFQFTLPKDGVA